jgi:signal transduction histidine kinase
VKVREILEDAAVLVRLKLEQSRVSLRWGNVLGEEEVFVDKGQIQQVLLNLMLNGIEVMPNGGEMYIDSECSYGRVNIYMKDQGSGIPEELRDRIFESFLTGRPGGTGLGLTISKRIMRAHDGDLELIKSDTQGTTFCITLPLFS